MVAGLALRVLNAAAHVASVQPRRHAAQRQAARRRRRPAAGTPAPGARVGRCRLVAAGLASARHAGRAPAGGRRPARPATAGRGRRLGARGVGGLACARPHGAPALAARRCGAGRRGAVCRRGRTAGLPLARLGARCAGTALVVAQRDGRPGCGRLVAPAGMAARRVGGAGAGAVGRARRRGGLCGVPAGARCRTGAAGRDCGLWPGSPGPVGAGRVAARRRGGSASRAQRTGWCAAARGCLAAVGRAASLAGAGARARHASARAGAAPFAGGGPGCCARTRVGAHAGLRRGAGAERVDATGRRTACDTGAAL